MNDLVMEHLHERLAEVRQLRAVLETLCASTHALLARHERGGEGACPECGLQEGHTETCGWADIMALTSEERKLWKS